MVILILFILSFKFCDDLYFVIFGTFPDREKQNTQNMSFLVKGYKEF